MAEIVMLPIEHLFPHKDNPRLEKCVKLLTWLGYNESQEEIKMRRGSLEAFDVGSDNEEDQDDGEM